MKTRCTKVFGVHAPPARLTWQAAALFALAVAMPGGAVVHWLWG